MARLHDDGQQDVNCTEILSPQPFAPPGKGFLVSSLESGNGIDPADNAQMSSPQEYGYNSSSSSTRHSTSDVFGREMDDELDQLKSRASSRSSLSSIPASVLIHPVDRMKQMPDMDIHEKIAGYRVEESEASFGDFNDVPANIRTIRHREAAFRKPSSVRAMQMHTEDEADEDEYLTPPRRRPGLRSRSPGASPLKRSPRSPYYSPNASKQPKPKKEAPLVLLHCTLLPPSIPVHGAADPRNQGILEDELPAEYWKRWRRLQDRVGSGVLRDRGVLISHPEDLYDILEERLLESLELQRPRLQNGHFVGREDDGSGSEGDFSDVEESETDGEQGDECPDCGNHVRHGDSNRKWEIRVFAANGLMRAGAWAAAWRDMEKVDVEVGLWLPSDVRRGLERRLAEEQMAIVEQAQIQTPQMQMQMQMQMSPMSDGGQQSLPEILQSPRQSHARMISDVGSSQSDEMTFGNGFSQAEARLDHAAEFGRQMKKEHEIALSTLLVNYIRVLAADRRNIALLILSVLVVFLAIGPRQQHVSIYSHLGSFPQALPNDFLHSSDMPRLSVGPSMSSSVSFARSVSATDALVDSSVRSVPTDFAAASETEVIPMPEISESASLILGSPGSHSQPPHSVEPIETTAPPQLLENYQVQLDEAPDYASLPAVPMESPIVPVEAVEPIETTQPQFEDNADAALVNTVDAPVVSSESSPYSTDSVESFVLSDVSIETAQPKFEDNAHDSLDDTMDSPVLLDMPTDNEQPQLESETETFLDDTVEPLVMPTESSSTDSVVSSVLLDVTTEIAQPNPEDEKEEQHEENEQTD
ncbi:uncharacterized protein N7479_000196 [Penicillium vulpinum]|uniref:Pathway-specific nitrogen regulator n=1 Tax=Penicillium vulpinum TaxID=29845 RepID=A0A1V6RXI7_9EURO|nr:uncharacterized protein N7479_000196 [Penicillium vulpinum]KAJ5970278.1 hypothetical protein N7479_000196 [Penicillium vulpinum]OQE06204.1 hypothetical protein PENVUL_c019G02208 [Penicillium vulpinum]